MFYLANVCISSKMSLISKDSLFLPRTQTLPLAVSGGCKSDIFERTWRHGVGRKSVSYSHNLHRVVDINCLGACEHSKVGSGILAAQKSADPKSRYGL